MDTLFLHPERWDLMLDDEGNIAYTKDPYAKAQDVASAIKLFKGELYYDKAKGIPYFEETLGKKQSLALYQYRLEKAALSVPEVVSVKASIQSNADRTVTGFIKFTDDKGRKVEVNL
ncbi:hypothetical protein Q7267_08580 [Glaesserella parasuis]|uniref:hypothetical protein n=1 Tax=Glaesserella parasuis TaxID=738 RepID=UPI0024372023|nr:hypothetical protein [Glaesserella parasuis]MDG6828536.1 hypothetical protein [Glaesserella parasuis]MDO9926759.1 hypothetical protein [Glaesserella parasuis]MDO9931242.1 hypothetical protein [Glaesserella parasuis]MDO9982360.1 hypothetical protein [Glaesserella parasuis]MDP0020457.1 hypothetical protein [Glaesserella parasuis]